VREEKTESFRDVVGEGRLGVCHLEVADLARQMLGIELHDGNHCKQGRKGK
jgi:hypothetical protein